MDAPGPDRPQELSKQLNSPAPDPAWWRHAILAAGRAAMWVVLTPPRRGLNAWSRLRPPQQLALGFASYALIGTALLRLPWAARGQGTTLDHLFNVVSAMSTTGLTTISVADSYTTFGQIVLLALFQLGGIGYMTLSSIVVLARGKPISDARLGILKAGFSLPHYFVMQRFVVHVVVFTAVVEAAGTLLLWWRFSLAGVESPLWSALFHSVSAFATAGFSLNNSSLETFADDRWVNGIIAVLCYLGAIGFIVVQDVWYSLRLRERMLTFTSKVILFTTALVFVLCTTAFFLCEPATRALPAGDRLLVSAFQAMTASSTAGFNTVPIGSLAPATFLVLMLAMLIGASPSGTGGGIKTTSVSALAANLFSVVRGRDRVVLLGHEVAAVRVLVAVASATLYCAVLGAGIFTLCLTERHAFLPLAFEAASALGTVGLSTGITGDLSAPGKVTVILLMFVGRCGPLTLGLALLRPEPPLPTLPRDDLAV